MCCALKVFGGVAPRDMPLLQASLGSLRSEPGARDSALSPLPGASSPARDPEPHRLGTRRWDGIPSSVARRKREFVPQERKDASYWDKREKNNHAAKRSREKRRLRDLQLERTVVVLMEENKHLKTELLTLRYQLGISEVPPHSQMWLTNVLSSFLPDLRTLRYPPGQVPFTGQGRGAASMDAVCVTSVLRHSAPRAETGWPAAGSHLAPRDAARPEQSAPQDRRLPLPASSHPSGERHTSGAHASLPHKRRAAESKGSSSGDNVVVGRDLH